MVEKKKKRIVIDPKRQGSRKEALELARSREGKGQEHKLEDGKIVSTTTEERRKTEIENISQKGVDIETRKEEIRKEREDLATEGETDQTTQTSESDVGLTGAQVLSSLVKIGETIETETIIQTDATGFQREVEMPVGTMQKIELAKARREGRVPLNELPTYQQFLLSVAVAGKLGGPGKGTKFITRGLKDLSKFMKGPLGKYIGQIAVGSGIITWLASDNIIGTMSIYGRDLAEDVKFGSTDSETALEKFDEGVAFVEQGVAFIKTATILNPLLWPFRSIILANAEAAKLALDENRNRITRGPVND